ncbi:ROK family transcriptional regulator [Agromyces albus]|uniref:ROK family transcriptional regulator n=1 Tax=Agromyces albus TaxID=205332 RepID=A0A4V1QYC4_9MICO|nr:ROK family transcriptional regulator [Agromyces albus]RXZ72666.1 ROK family transcriptional regulator [Agromyces albus]
MTDATTTEASRSARELAREVLIHGPISRSELGRRLGLSPASLTRLSKPFLDLGLFVEGVEEQKGAIGRPAKPLDVRVDARRFIGIKVTGDDVLGVATDLRATAQTRAAHALGGHDVAAVVEAIAAVVREVAAASGTGDLTDVAGVGLSIGGNVAGRRIVKRAPFLEWRDVPLADLLERELGGLPVTVENDVTALTTAEQWFGAGRGLPNFAVVTIGAGVGYGLVMHDRVIVTPDSGLGLAGHLPLDASGPLCIEGHRGCSTAMLSIPGICAQLGIALGREVRYDEVLELAEAGHPLAVSITTAAGRALGRMLAYIANLAMVDTVVLSGEGIGLWRVAEGAAREALAADRDAEASPLQLHVDDAGFVSWARGAAAIAIEDAFARLRLSA